MEACSAVRRGVSERLPVRAASYSSGEATLGQIPDLKGVRPERASPHRPSRSLHLSKPARSPVPEVNDVRPAHFHSNPSVGHARPSPSGGRTRPTETATQGPARSGFAAVRICSRPPAVFRFRRRPSDCDAQDKRVIASGRSPLRLRPRRKRGDDIAASSRRHYLREFSWAVVVCLCACSLCS